MALVGSGNLAYALGPALVKAGYRIHAIVTRSLTRSRNRAAILAKRLHSKVVTLECFEPSADVIWICHTDDALAETARTLARHGNWKNKVVLHSSGALTSDVLTPLRLAGAFTASLHPMMTFVPGTEPSMKKVPFAVEGDSKAVAMARKIVQRLKGHTFPIRKQSKVLYHALGSFSSPMVVATLVTGERVGRAAGLSKKQVTQIMRPILEQTMRNYLERGAAAAFSGPIKRADLDTVRNHLRELAGVPAANELYQSLVRSALIDLPVKDRARLSALLKK